VLPPLIDASIVVAAATWVVAAPAVSASLMAMSLAVAAGVVARVAVAAAGVNSLTPPSSNSMAATLIAFSR
jgi:hypothetical protein